MEHLASTVRKTTNGSSSKSRLPTNPHSHSKATAEVNKNSAVLSPQIFRVELALLYKQSFNVSHESICRIRIIINSRLEVLSSSATAAVQLRQREFNAKRKIANEMRHETL
jgi:hypothetical protein